MYHLKSIACTLLCVAASLSVCAQANEDTRVAGTTSTRAVMQPDVQPVFIGNWNKFLSRNLHYPAQAEEQGLQGKAMVEFVVLESGLIDNIHIQKSAGHKLLDEEALRVVRLMQSKAYWKPGRKNGLEVRSAFKVAVDFNIN